MFAASGNTARALQWLLTIAIVFAGWLVFRAPSLHDLGVHLQALFTLRGGLRPALIRESGCLVILLISGFAMLTTWLHALPLPRFLSGPWLRPALYATVLVSVITMDREATAFIYFQF